MKSCELNKLLVESFPNLKKEYLEEVDWQEGDNTGAHTVYGDVFTPYLVSCIENDRQEEIIKAFVYIETLLKLKDTYAEEVATFSVLESIAYLFEERKGLYDLLGEQSKESIKEFL